MFETQWGVTHSQAEARPTFNRHGDRTVSTSVISSDESGWSSSNTNQLSLESAVELLVQLGSAVEAHYADILTPKSPKDMP